MNQGATHSLGTRVALMERQVRGFAATLVEEQNQREASEDERTARVALRRFAWLRRFWRGTPR